MACANIHLAIAKTYLKQHPEINEKDFLRGTIFVDAVKFDDYTHYTDRNRKEDLLSHLKGKVVLKDFLKDHQNLSDFEKGWFLHLITDYRFFHECFDREYLKKCTYTEFKERLYKTYYSLNTYLMKTYNITIEDYYEYTKEFFPGRDYEDCLLTKENVDNFIKKVASISLEEYKKEIENNKYN